MCLAAVGPIEEAGRTPRELRARLTIGADGLHSLLARDMGVRRTGPLRRFAFVAHVAGVTSLGPTAEMHVAGDGYVGLNPLMAYVMGLEAAKSRPANDRERAEMCRLLTEAMEAGGAGFSAHSCRMGTDRS